MVAPASFAGRVAFVLRVASPPRYAGPAIVGLGLAAAVLEGWALILFIPLVQSLGAAPPSNGDVIRLLDRLLPSAPTAQLTAWLVAALCASILLKNVVNLLNTWLTRRVDGTVAHRVRTLIFAQTLSSCIDYRTSVRRADLATTVSTNSWKVSNALTLVYRMVVALVTFVVFVVLMIGISPWLTLVAMLSLFAAALIIRFSTRKADAVGQAVVEENKRFGQRMWESVQSLQLIRAFGREDYECRRFEDSSERVRRRILTLDLLWAFPGPLSEVAITILIGALILVAKSAGVGIAALAAFLSLLYRLQGPTRELMQSKVALDGLTAAVEDVAELLAASEQPFLIDGAQPAAAPHSAIAFRDVSFRYTADDPWALRDVSFDIPVGKTTAIVGESGAGKSTLLSLLFRFRDPTRGSVECDGVSLAELRVAEWRSRLALMSQDVQLFHDSIGANISYGRLEASAEEVRAAAKVARADEFIAALPQGYDTIIGDQGLRLSGGQRQRIALARTLLRNPDVLLLDEATNALDVESEQAFQLALERYAHRATVVVIAHRLWTVQNADQIIVLAKGRVIETGPPDRLLSDAGHFARLFHLQQGPPRKPQVLG